MIHDMRDRIESRFVDGCQSFQGIWTRFISRPITLAFIQGANLSNLIIGELSTGIAFPRLLKSVWHQCASALFNRIHVVIGLSTEKQMIGPNTWWIVATVKNLQSLWNLTIMQFPREAMSGWANTILLSTTHAESPITKMTDRSRPDPTRICSAHVGPKATFNGLFHGRRF